jgi:hypothetical protein
MLDVLGIFHSLSHIVTSRLGMQSWDSVCTNSLFDLIIALAESQHFQCEEIRQMVLFFFNLSCPKNYHKPDHLIHVVQYSITNTCLYSIV